MPRHLASSRNLIASVTAFLLPLGSAQAATLLHHWKLDEGTGSVVSDSVGSAEMHIIGSISGGWTAGKDGNAFRFNGINFAQTDNKDTVQSPGSAVAIAGWFKTSTTDNRAFLFQIETLYELRINRGQMQLSFNGSSSTAPKWGENLNDGLWHHFVAQQTGGVTQLYLDGVLIGSRNETLGNLGSVSKDSAIGALQNGNNAFAGTMDDMRYYSGALTLNEIRLLAGIANIPPTAYADSYSGSVNTTLNVAAPGLLANDVEMEGDVVTAVLETNVTQGTLNLQPDGSFTYAPPTGFVGDMTFTYRARDKDGDSAPATVVLTILDPASSLSAEEVSRIESDLGITLTTQQKLDLAAVVKPQTIASWRTDANLRIEAHRKANLSVAVTDQAGVPVVGATVRAKLKKHAFKFGGVVTVMDLTDAAGSLSAAGSTTTDWQRITRALFNSLGFDNALKPKTVNQHTYVPQFLTWAAANGLDVRGHLLMWPGGGTVDMLDDAGAVSGVDYGDHLSNSGTSAYKHHNVLGAVDAYKASARTQADRNALKSVVDAEIQEWAGRWNVYEWDVINETLNNTLLMDILGYDQMTSWFNLAQANKVNPACGLLINDYQIISAKFDAGSTSYATRRDTYFSRIDLLLSGTATVTGIGFQSRFKFFNNYSPVTVFARIQDFSTRYPNLNLVGTEFEIPDHYDFVTGALVQAYDESTRAHVTEEILTTYFSHQNMTGLNAWDFMNPLPDNTANAYTRALCYYGDGPGGVAGPVVKLNGLVWYYLHRIRYHTDTTAVTSGSGTALIRGFKGDYDLTVSYEGEDYPATFSLAQDGTTTVTLSDVTLVPPRDPVVVEHWPFNDAAGVQLKDSVKASGTTTFTAATVSATTDGGGRLRIVQDAAKTTQGGGSFLNSQTIAIGPRTSGTFEMEFLITSGSLTTGDASGANLGFGLRDSAANADLFRVRLNKTAAGLAVSTFIDNTYTTIKNFTGLFALSAPLKIRSVIDLDGGTADVFLTEGQGAELPKVTVNLSGTASTWTQISYTAVNNTVDWGPSDAVSIDYLRIQKLRPDNFALWSHSRDWQGEMASGRNEDPDGDGLSNFMEFVLGGNPISADAAQIAPHLASSGNTPAMQFTLGADSVDVSYLVEFSENLSDWTTIPPLVVHGEAGANITVPLPVGTRSKCFLRVSASDGQ